MHDHVSGCTKNKTACEQFMSLCDRRWGSILVLLFYSIFKAAQELFMYQTVWMRQEFIRQWHYKNMELYLGFYVLLCSRYLSNALYKYRIRYDPYMTSCGHGGKYMHKYISDRDIHLRIQINPIPITIIGNKSLFFII